MLNFVHPIPNPAPMHHVSAFGVPDRCSDCRRPFDQRDPLRRMRTLEDRLALCSECTWHLEHPHEPGR